MGDETKDDGAKVDSTPVSDRAISQEALQLVVESEITVAAARQICIAPQMTAEQFAGRAGRIFTLALLQATRRDARREAEEVLK